MGEPEYRARGRGMSFRQSSSQSAQDPTGHGRIAPFSTGREPSDATISAADQSSCSSVESRSQSESLSMAGGRVRRGRSPGSSRGSPERLRGTFRGFRHDVENVSKTRREDLVSKQGSSGTAILLQANYFALLKMPTWNLRQYTVNFEPRVASSKLRKEFLQQHQIRLKRYIYDGASIVFSSDETADEVMELDCVDRQNGKLHKLRLTKVAGLEIGDGTHLQVLNILLRRWMDVLQLEEIGRHYYNMEETITVTNNNLKLIPGFITSFRQHENEVLLCVDTTTKVLRNDTVLENMKGLKSSSNYQTTAEEMLIGAVVLTKYNNRTYTVSDIEWNLSPLSTFERNNEDVTYKQYYEEQYGIFIEDMSQPLLATKTNIREFHRRKSAGPIYLVPELCHMTGLTSEMRANMGLMRELSRHLHLSPQDRVNAIRKFMDRLLENPKIQQELEMWNLRLSDRLINCPGRILPKESVVFNCASGKRELVNEKCDWTKLCRSNNMFSIGEMKNWTIIVPQHDAKYVDSFLKTLMKVSGPLGMKMSKPNEIITVADANPGSYILAIDRLRNKPNDLVFIILATNKKELYSAVKRRLSGELGIISQCFLAKNLRSKNLMSIATKVVIQMNAKVGGEPWLVKIPLQSMLIVGLDVYHPTKATGGRTLAAMVASITPNHGKFFSTVSTYDSCDELSLCIAADLIKCVQAYHQTNKELPKRILFYRDGVGEGQLEFVSQAEVAQMNEALKKFYGDFNEPMPRLAFIVVSKKTNTKLFTAEEPAHNPPPGTVCDDVITYPERYDFNLISATAAQGTVSPVAYNILYDSMKLDPDKMQRLTFKLCHMYFNWSGTVAVPAHCQYARKLAQLTGLSVGDAVHFNLCYNLHFL